jgi:ribosomal protein S18 acetylase RimI-like enzyme
VSAVDPAGTPDGSVPPRVRVAGVSEVPSLVALVESAYRGESSAEGWTSESELLGGQRTDADAVRALVVSTHDVVLVMGEPHAPIACCAVGHHGGPATFGMFAVGPAGQGRGTGRGMLAAAEAYAAERWGAREMELTVIRQRDALIAWYERRGYARTGETRPFPYGDERFGIPLRDDLEFVVLRRALG